MQDYVALHGNPYAEKSLCGRSTGLVYDAMGWKPVPLRQLSPTHSALQVSKMPPPPHLLCTLRDYVQPLPRAVSPFPFCGPYAE